MRKKKKIPNRKGPLLAQGPLGNCPGCPYGRSGLGQPAPVAAAAAAAAASIRAAGGVTGNTVSGGRSRALVSGGRSRALVMASRIARDSFNSFVQTKVSLVYLYHYFFF